MTAAQAEDPTIVVGAGVAGLSCARALADAGRAVLVLERARGVGGRCATRRVREQPVDFGVAFLHGRAPAFLAALDAVPATRLSGWPAVVEGGGRPCQPDAFAPGERRLAFAEGVSALPKHLARGLDVRTSARVVALSAEGGALRVALEGGASVSARTVVLALAGEQAAALLAASALAAPAIDTARALLGMVRSHPCLTVIAGYPLEVPAPAWDLHLPDASRVLQLIAHDSTKRAAPTYRALVYQAEARWSLEHLDDPAWAPAMLAEGGRLLGPWAAAPSFSEPHRWRYARTDRGAELSAPLLLGLPGGARLGLAGELFAAGGGVEGAWISGQRLARRILEDERTDVEERR
jgi:hypothetical protein